MRDGRLLIALELVVCSLALLDRVHFLPPDEHVFWNWAGTLPDPSDWNSDALATKDRVRILRTQLMLTEVIRVNSLEDAELFIELIGCTPEGSFAEVGGALVVDCSFWLKRPQDRIQLAFAVDSPDGGNRAASPSLVLPPDVFRRKADQAVALVPVYPADLKTVPPLREDAKHQLAEAARCLLRLRSYIPEGEEFVPVGAFWGDAPRADREVWPERYARGRIDATLDRWRAELEVFGEPVLRDARSAEEAYVFMAIHPCPRCGTDTPRLQSRLEAAGTDLISVYAGACPICELPRRFAFRLPEMPVFQSGDAIELGPERSTCLDPGQLLLAADQFAQEAGDDVDDAALQRLELSIACLDEILKWVAESGRVPEEVITSRVGWAVYEQEPGRFEASRLRAVRDTYRGIVDAALSSESR